MPPPPVDLSSYELSTVFDQLKTDKSWKMLRFTFIKHVGTETIEGWSGPAYEKHDVFIKETELIEFLQAKNRKVTVRERDLSDE